MTPVVPSTEPTVNDSVSKIEIIMTPKVSQSSDDSETESRVSTSVENTVSVVETSSMTNGDTTADEENEEKKGDQEVVFIQDVGFTVKIVSPGTQSFDIQVSSMELVQEIHQILMDREDTCHRTCFSLQLDGATLDNFAELKNIEGLKEGSVIKVSVIIFFCKNAIFYLSSFVLYY